MKQIAGDSLGDEFKGYLLKITGGNDKQGTDGQPLLFIMVPMIPCYGGKDWKSWDSGERWNHGNHAFLKAIAKRKHGLTVLIFRFPHEAGWYVIDRPNQQNHRIRNSSIFQFSFPPVPACSSPTATAATAPAAPVSASASPSVVVCLAPHRTRTAVCAPRKNEKRNRLLICPYSHHQLRSRRSGPEHRQAG